MAVIKIDHPLIQDCLAKLRDRKTTNPEFRSRVRRITALLVYKATENLETEACRIETSLGVADSKKISDPGIVLVPILRTGIGMMDAMLELFPHAIIGLIGLRRDEEIFAPRHYFISLPEDLSRKTVIILDPMLATGGTLAAAIDIIKERGCKNIRAITIITAPEGAALVEAKHPDVPVYTAAVDERLNDKAYIVPGLGDAGDRTFSVI